MSTKYSKPSALALSLLIAFCLYSCGDGGKGNFVLGGSSFTSDGEGDAQTGGLGQGVRPIDLVSIDLSLDRLERELVVSLGFDAGQPFVSPTQSFELGLGGMIDIQVGGSTTSSELSGPVHWFAQQLGCLDCGVSRTHTVDLFSEFEHEGMLRVENASGEMVGFAMVIYEMNRAIVRVPLESISAGGATPALCRVSVIVSDDTGVTDVLDTGYVEIDLSGA